MKIFVLHLLILVLFVSSSVVAKAKDDIEVFGHSFHFIPLSEESGVSVPEYMQQFVGVNTWTNPDQLLERVLVTQNEKTEVLFRAVDGVVFKQIGTSIAKTLFLKITENEKRSDFKVFVSNLNYGRIDLAIVKNYSLDQYCKLDILGYPKNAEESCVWHESWPSGGNAPSSSESTRRGSSTTGTGTSR